MPQYLSITNGYVTYNTSDTQVIATYNCLPGFRLSSADNIRNCHLIEPGVNADWSGTPPQCEGMV